METPNNQLGVFWGNDGLYFVESKDLKPTKIFNATFTEECKGSIKGGPLSPVGMAMISLVVETMRQQRTPMSMVNLSLPTHEIIFRSFTIPWMPSSEIKDVIEFEATKYIPFSLRELAYAYQPLTVSEAGVKRIRVVFTAVKKDALENYTSIMEQAGFDIQTIEPSTISLIRVLSERKILVEDQTIGLIEMGHEWGKISIINMGLPQFVREFSLKSTPTSTDEKSKLSQLISESRISLNYFGRQDTQMEISKVLVLASNPSSELATSLEKEIGIPVASINTQTIMGDTSLTQLGVVNAYGSSLVDPMSKPSAFNLSQKKPKVIKKVKSAPVKSSLNFKSVVTTAMICIPLILISLFLSRGVMDKPQKAVAQLTSQLGQYVDMLPETLKEKQNSLIDKIKNYKEIRIRSDVSKVLILLPGLLPEGTWLKTIEMTYPTFGNNISKTTLDMTGYVYLENTKEQFRLVHTILTLLKNSKQFSESFSDIQLETVKVERLEDYTVTFFKIKCQ